MPLYGALLILGSLFLFQLDRLPSPGWLGALLPIAIGLAISRRLRWAAVVLAGFSWALTYVWLTQPAFLPGDDSRFSAIVTGTLVDLPRARGDLSRFVLDVDKLQLADEEFNGRWRVNLAWRDAPDLRPGQRWRLGVRLRHVHGYASPGAWDIEGWYYWRGIRYRGYVADPATAERLHAEACCAIDRLRHRLSVALADLSVSAQASGVMRALVVGDRAALGTDLRELLRLTGTAHLMAISGLHIGLVAGLAMVLVSAAWRRTPPLCARVPARLAGASAGLACALLYAVLAGFGLPTQRAVIMLAVGVVALISRRGTGFLQPLSLAALLVVIGHPPSVIQPGFWLSFTAVLAMLATWRIVGWQSGWRALVAIQLALWLGLWPLLAVFGLPNPVVAPLANLLVVPLFGLLVVPGALLGTLLLPLLPGLASPLLGLVGELLDLVLVLLDALRQLDLPTLERSPGLYETVAMIAGIIVLLAPRGFGYRALGLPLLAAVLWPRMPEHAHGDFALHLLDVGQGLSAVVETRNHRLVFDTGPAYRSGHAAAEAVLLPFLRSRPNTQIDRLVVSHGDNDHAGGLAALVSAVDIDDVIAGEPERIKIAARRCYAGERWVWDGVVFEVLHPKLDSGLTGNNASCVLRVQNAGGSLLLTGDIESRVERQLVADMHERLRADVVIAGHHGSRSSSSPDFVDATGAKQVLYAAGWANRYDFPAADVVSRWRQSGAIDYNTATGGTLRYHYDHAAREIRGPEAYRDQRRRFWHHDLGSALGRHAVSSAD